MSNPVKIPVTFRVDKANPPVDGVTAVFTSRETHPTNSPDIRACYARIGQHSECSMHWVRECTRPATPGEYASLLQELKQVYEGDGLAVLEVCDHAQNAS